MDCQGFTVDYPSVRRLHINIYFQSLHRYHFFRCGPKSFRYFLISHVRCQGGLTGKALEFTTA